MPRYALSAATVVCKINFFAHKKKTEPFGSVFFFLLSKILN